MYQYIRQSNYYSCGPIALYNLLTWCNMHHILSYREIYKLSNCDPQIGTSTSNFESVLKILNFDKQISVRFWHTKFNNIKQILNENHNLAAVVEFVKNGKYLHYALIFTEWKSTTTPESKKSESKKSNSKKSNSKKLVIVNEGAENKNSPIVKDFHLHELTTTFNLAYPIFWIIEKKTE